jgi:type I restriction enzyme S subunit
MDKIKLLGRGVTFKEVSKSAIADFGVVTPPLTNQQQFAEIIEAIENQKKLVKKSLQEVETLFNSRMDYYFN